MARAAAYVATAVAVIGLVTVPAAVAQKRAGGQAGTTAAKPPAFTKQQIQWVEQARAVVNSLNSQEAQILGDIRIAEVLCHRQPQQAADLLQTARQNLTIVQQNRNSDPSPSGAPRHDPLAWNINYELRTTAGRCDPALANALDRHQRKKTNAFQGAADLAGQQIRDGHDQDASNTLKTAINNGDFVRAKQNFWQETEDLLGALMNLRVKRPKEADALYLMELGKVQASPELLSIEGLANLGTYPFTAKRIPASAPPTAVYFVVPVPGEPNDLPLMDTMRAGMDPAVANAYVQLALTMMGDSSLRSGQAVYAYWLAKELTPLVSAFLPNQSSALALVLQELARKIPAPSQKPVKVRAATADNTSIDDLKKIKDPKQRDALLVMTAFMLAEHGRFDRAEEAVDALSDQSMRDQVAPLIQFSRAKAALAAGDLGTAAQLTGQLPKDRTQVLMLCGLAAAYAKQSNLPAARDELSLASEASGQLPVLYRAPVELEVEGLLARFDPDAAKSYLPILTRDMNRLDDELDAPPPRDATAMDTAWRQYLQEHQVERRPLNWQIQFTSNSVIEIFNLWVPGMKPATLGGIPALLHLSGDDAFAWLAGVNHDARKLQILPGLLGYLLQPPKPQPPPRSLPMAARTAGH